MNGQPLGKGSGQNKAIWAFVWVAALAACGHAMPSGTPPVEDTPSGGGGQAGERQAGVGTAGAGGQGGPVTSAGTAGMAGGSACPEGTSPCGDRCVDLKSDAAHCGSCDVACAGVKRCEVGVCAGVAEISAGLGFTCARMTNGRVRCWGANDTGQLGNGQNVSSQTPVTVPGVEGAAQVSCGGWHACVRGQDGSLSCWGDNEKSQLGDGTSEDSLVPKQILGPEAKIANVATAPYHTCAANAGGAVKCWGANGGSQVGHSSEGPVALPSTVEGLYGILSVDAGLDHSCALRNDGLAWCWGSNQRLQLGCHDEVSCYQGQAGHGNEVPSPVQVYSSEAKNLVRLAVGLNHSCALRADQTVWCWGDNDHAQLGVGIPPIAPPAYEDVRDPTRVPGLASIVQITSLVDHSCALSADGAVWCWGGFNTDGQLGDGTTKSEGSPVNVVNLGRATQVSAGEDHTCARLADGSAWCWGSNASGQLGNGGVTSSKYPVQVLGLDDGLLGR